MGHAREKWFAWVAGFEMRWRKLGHLFSPPPGDTNGSTGASMPVAEVLDESSGLVRVYFSPRDGLNRSQISFFDFYVGEPQKIVYTATKPLLTHGGLGTFDEFGVMLGSVLAVGRRKLIFYTGWSRTYGVPYNNSIGVAEIQEDGSARRLGEGPMMTRTLQEPYSCASPFVMYDGGGYKMWYASMDKWENTQGEPKHFYNIKFASSADGVVWERNADVAIDYQTSEEYAFGRPYVAIEDGLFKMWYPFRGLNYQLGYAESHNGVDWERKDHLVGISVSKQGWDSEMIEYPFIFGVGNDRYLLYNGNGYGASGIGLAVLEK